MVLGLRSKSRKGPSVNVDYLVHLQEIKPWPPSNSLKSARSVLLQWENGDRNSGSTSSVVPSLGSGVGDGKIEFNESFKITVTLSRELSVKGGNADTFQKNCLELNLYELRSNKAVKGQILGTVVVDLAEYGILKETKTISAPVNCKRSFRNTAQPVLLIKIEPYQKRNSRSLSMESLSKGTSLDKDGKETVSESMNGDYDDETEIAAFTDDDDDDASQHSSLTVSSSAFEATEGSPQSEENAFETVEDSPGRDKHVSDLSLKQEAARTDVTPVTATQVHVTRSSSHSSSVDSSSEVVNLENNSPSLSDLPEKNLISDTIPATQSVLSSSSIAYGEEEVICNHSSQIFDHKNMEVEIHEKITDGRSIIKQDAQLPVEERKTSELEASASPGIDTSVNDKPGLATSVESDFQEVDAKIDRGQSRVVTDEALKINDSHAGLKEVRDGKELENGQREETEGQQCQPTELEASYNFSPDNTRRPVESVGDAIHSRRDPEIKNDSLPSTKLKHVKSVRSLLDSARSKKLESNNQFTAESGETNSLQHAHRSDENLLQNGREDTMSLSRETKNNLSDSKLQQLEQRIEGLERELREAAALEVALYSVVAEHGSSANKVHAPARRLSRLYLHAWKHSKSRRATAARSAVSGLVLVAKACGNDVPRLTFWLSNSVVLRAIISAALGDSQLPVSAGPHNETNDGAKGNEKTSSLLKWQESSIRKNQSKFGLAGSGDEWEETQTFTTSLENIEAWIFSRIIESVWWQTLTPHMQSSSKASETIITSNLRNSYGRRPSLSDQEQANFSMELWNKAFKDACERLCPVRAAGHECGCLPVLAKLVMEQCVSRLDVAMFNALLRESADDIPTDPVSDPISDSKVLPIPAGKSSFGAGAQLKNAIGNWSRWLTDLFDLDEDDSHEVLNDLDEDDIQEGDTSSKSFHLLNALSDLMMLPKDMLLDRSIRKEVCPTFDAPLIKRILSDFSPDEFCPDPIPEEVFQALDEEDLLHDEEESFTNFPSKAAPVIYSPPSAALLASFIGEPGKESQLRRSSSSVLRKSYTSDDELDELDSPLASITSSFRSTSTPSWKAKENGVRKVLRYELLQEVWREGD